MMNSQNGQHGSIFRRQRNYGTISIVVIVMEYQIGVYGHSSDATLWQTWNSACPRIKTLTRILTTVYYKSLGYHND